MLFRMDRIKPIGTYIEIVFNLYLYYCHRYAPTIIDALVSSIDDQDEVIAMESMLGLSRVFGIVDESRVAPILVNICHRIRPAFEKVLPTIIHHEIFFIYHIFYRVMMIFERHRLLYLVRCGDLVKIVQQMRFTSKCTLTYLPLRSM